MHIEQTTERYRFACRACGAHWAWDYDVRRHEYPGDTVVEAYSRDGRSVVPPTCEPRCPSCGGVQASVVGVTTLSTTAPA
ncbi:MAG TPA: hypothetical protein VFC33_15715 [Acidimicrobiia bacterium]|nr:hypothetical protein [Acidimicrobiia bacterium]